MFSTRVVSRSRRFAPGRSLLTSVVALAVAVAGGSFFLFNTVLRVPLPRGPLGL